MRAARTIGSTIAMFATLAVLVAVAALGRTEGTASVGAIGSVRPVSSTVPTVPAPSIGLGLGCGTFTLEVLKAATSWIELANLSDEVLVGTVTGIGEGQWATSDGNQPKLDDGRRPTALDVFRPVHIRIDDVAQDDGHLDAARGNEVDAQLVGGTIGCRTFVVSGQVDPTPGSQFLVFLSSDRRGVSTDPGVEIVDMWPVRDGIASHGWSSIAIEDLLAAAKRS